MGYEGGGRRPPSARRPPQAAEPALAARNRARLRLRDAYGDGPAQLLLSHSPIARPGQPQVCPHPQEGGKGGWILPGRGSLFLPRYHLTLAAEFQARVADMGVGVMRLLSGLIADTLRALFGGGRNVVARNGRGVSLKTPKRAAARAVQPPRHMGPRWRSLRPSFRRENRRSWFRPADGWDEPPAAPFALALSNPGAFHWRLRWLIPCGLQPVCSGLDRWCQNPCGGFWALVRSSAFTLARASR